MTTEIVIGLEGALLAVLGAAWVGAILHEATHALVALWAGYDVDVTVSLWTLSIDRNGRPQGVTGRHSDVRSWADLFALHVDYGPTADRATLRQALVNGSPQLVGLVVGYYLLAKWMWGWAPGVVAWFGIAAWAVYTFNGASSDYEVVRDYVDANREGWRARWHEAAQWQRDGVILTVILVGTALTFGLATIAWALVLPAGVYSVVFLRSLLRAKYGRSDEPGPEEVTG